MNDEFFDRLKANDPASPAEPDLTGIKARVDAHTADNIVPLPSRRHIGRGLRIAASIGALALAGGIGFAGGNLSGTGTAEVKESSSTSPEVAPDANRVGGTGLGGGATAADAKVANFGGGYWGAAILKPAGSISNTAGTASAYTFSSDGVDKRAVTLAIAKALGIATRDPEQQDGGYALTNDTGLYNVFVGGDAFGWFSGYTQDRAPWTCDQSPSGKEQTDAERQATQEKCDAEWPTPSKADAIAQAKQVFASLGLDTIDGAQYSAYSYNPRLMTVVMTPVIDGMPVGQTWQAEVGKQGVFSVYGYATKVVKTSTYPTVGARDAAARSELRKWQAFGPQQVFDADAQNVGLAGGTAPTVKTKDGKPMLQASIAEVDVTSAQRGVMQVYLADGTAMLMPAWTFVATDGSRWQMLAIAEDYIDWTSAPAGGPVAYATDARTATSGSASVAAPMMK